MPACTFQVQNKKSGCIPARFPGGVHRFVKGVRPVRNGIDTEYYAQHIQCTRDAKSECLYTVQQLLELCFAAREHGMLKMDELINDRVRYPDAFLRKAVALVIEVSNPDNIRDVLHNYIFTSSNVGNQKFLNCMMITEAMIALSRGEDLDYIFTYLVPSFFGFEYEAESRNIYQQFKQNLRTRGT